MKAMKNARIPEFKTLEEEREYWEARGPLAEGKKGRVNRPSPGQKRSSFLAVRLKGEELTRLRDVAAKQGLGPSTYARLVLTAAIEQGSKPPTKKTLEDVFEALDKNISQQTKDRMGALFKTMSIGDPPYLLELTDRNKFEEFGRLSAGALLSLAGIEVVSKETEQPPEERSKAPA